MNIFFLQYNNYYNRIVKKFDDLNEYLSDRNYEVRESVNFNAGDGISTDITVNWTNDWMPDYLITNNGETLTRWFIINHYKTRGQQYKMLLKRDLVADNWDKIIEADCFIEKGIVDPENPLVFNREDFTVNQIKTDEILLRDKTKCPWIVGYYPENIQDPADDAENPVVGSLSAEFSQDLYFDAAINTSYDEWYASLNNSFKANKWVLGLQLEEFHGSEGRQNYSMVLNQNGYLETAYTVSEFTGIAYNNWFTNKPFPDAKTVSDWFTDYPVIINTAKSAYTSIKFTNDDLLRFNNKIVKFTDSEGKVEYRLISINTQNSMDSLAISSLNAGSLYDVIFNQVKSYIRTGLGVTNVYTLTVTGVIQSISSRTLFSDRYSLEIPSNSIRLVDAPYKMFCMPYPFELETFRIHYKGSSETVSYISVPCSADISYKMASALSRKYTGANGIFDIQILPYCPIGNITFEDGTFDIRDLPQNGFSFIKKYDPVREEDIIAGFVVFPEKCSFTVEIPLDNPIFIKNAKIENQTDMYRLVSPNYNGEFQFNAAMNGGINSFNADCTYLPYNPYIHVNPDFNLLYGKDFNDCRGLLCLGDFSITQINDAWQSYQIQNKNYQNIFNREISNMVVDQDVQRRKEQIKIATDTINATMKGASTGGVYGAAIAGGTKAIEGITNYNLSEQLRSEALDYKNDMFGYSLGNIKALPQSISKTTGYTYNNKYFPVLEYYTCTPTEKLALANKIAYNSMSIMAIGKLKDYINNKWEYSFTDPITEKEELITSKGYIKGSLIRLEGFDDDFHILNAIADEIYKGVYYEGN